jgi:hypothetical protein
MDDDLAPSKTEGFKVGEKKTIDEYKNLGGLILPSVVVCYAVGETKARGSKEYG